MSLMADGELTPPPELNFQMNNILVFWGIDTQQHAIQNKAAVVSASEQDMPVQ